MEINNNFMKSLKTIFTLLVVSVILFSCNRDLTEDFIATEPVDIEYKWWILTHRNYANSGIFLYNETTVFFY